MIHLEFIFMQSMRLSVRFSFSLYGYSTAPVPFFEKPIFLQLNCVCTSVKNQYSIYVCISFWILYSVPLIYVNIPLPIPHGLVTVAT